MDLELRLEECVLVSVDFSVMLEQRGSAKGAGEIVRKLCRLYRAMGIYDYLVNADLYGLHYGLIQSAMARKAYLTETALEPLESESVRRSSLNASFFDALAASQWGVARAIAELSPRHTNSELEYEDDYLYARILYYIVLAGHAGGADLNRQVERFGEVLEGQPSQRFEICRSFQEGAHEDFAEAFSDLLRAYSETMESAADPISGEAVAQESDFEANRNLWVEGIALLAIAKSLGIETKDQYILCPTIAAPADFRFEPRSYPMLPL